ncbi:MAG: 4Fe-4S binding protein [Deltaproteobacteria bacterium]|nr:4Fe-4S binding protein [Deltaproteobacteria bacterium]
MTKNNKISLRNRKSDLRKLVTLMNRQNKRFMPPFDPILKTIDLMITPEELGLLLKMNTATYSYEQVAALSGMNSEKFNPIFESLLQKVFIGIHETKTGEEQYSLNPFIVGWFEGVVTYLLGKPEEKEFAQRYMSFFDSLRNRNYFPVRKAMDIIGRLSPVTNQSVGTVYESKNAKGKSTIIIDETIVAPDSMIYPTSSINDMIKEYGSKSIIGQFKACMCREMTSQIDDPCRLKMPGDIGCMGFGDKIKPALKYGYMRQVSKEEAFDIIQKARDCGAVHTVFHEKDDAKLPQTGLCNCCWDCCGIFRSYNMGAVPLRYSCYYLAKIMDSSKCTGCGKCAKYCPTAAISVLDKKVELDTKKCIGCGQCVHQCVRSVVELIEDKRTAFLPMLKKSEARITA